MTEKEAKTKACCGPRNNAQTAEDSDVLCIGTACMAWRWAGNKTAPADIGTIAAHMREHGVGPLDATSATSTSVQTGYCGLAGAPR